MSRSRRSTESGFTLIELMIALVVAAILAAIAVPTYRQSIAKQRISSGRADLASLALNLDGKLLSESAYPASPINNTAGLRTALPGWVPVATAHFSYALTEANSGATPPSYTITATGTSSLTQGCVLTLRSTGMLTAPGCAGGVPTW